MAREKTAYMLWRLLPKSRNDPTLPLRMARMKVRPNRAIGIARRARKEWWYAPHRAIVAVGVLLISLAVFAGTLGVIKSTQA